METPATILLYKLTPERLKLNKLNPHHKNKKGDRISADRALSDFMVHLKWLSSRHIKKPYSQEYLISTCFSKSKFMTRTVAKAYCRAQLSVAEIQFDRLLTLLKGNTPAIS